MNGRILLDTNIVIAVFSGEESIQRYIEKANEIFIPVIVIGELYFGALYG
jgi:tRNA(fMet)-specific endonuclease VapC